MICSECREVMTLEDVTVTIPALPNQSPLSQEQLSAMNENMKKLFPDWDPLKMTEEQLLEMCGSGAAKDRSFEMYVCHRCGHTESAHEPDPSWI